MSTPDWMQGQKLIGSRLVSRPLNNESILYSYGITQRTLFKFVYEPTHEQFALSLFGVIEINKLTRQSVNMLGKCETESEFINSE